MADDDAPGPREVLLVAARLHLGRAAAVDDGDLLGAQKLGLHGDVDGGHAAADDDDAAPDGERARVRRLAQLGDEIHRVEDTVEILALETEAVGPGHAEAEEDGVIVPPELVEGDVGPEPDPVFHRDATDREDEIDLAPGEIVHRLVGGDAVFVEAAGLLPRVEDGDLVALDGEAVGAGEPRRARPDDGDPPPARRGPGEGLMPRRHQGVHGKPLQHADADRPALAAVAHADLLAQGLGRADPGAHSAHDVPGKDRRRRPLHVAGGDPADEKRHVDGRRAGRDAGRVEAEITPVRLDRGFLPAQRRMQVGEVAGAFLRREPARRDIPDVLRRRHGETSRMSDPPARSPARRTPGFGPADAIFLSFGQNFTRRSRTLAGGRERRAQAVYSMAMAV